MMSKQETATCWFGWWGWYTDKLEAWLETKALQGWHVTGADQAVMRFRFERGESRRVRYCADYQEKLDPHYLTLCQDAGWELVSMGYSWYIWRMEYAGARPEVISDLDSLLDRNVRLRRLLAGAVLPGLPAIVLLLTSGALQRLPFSKYLLGLVTVAVTFDLFCLIAISRQNQMLRKRKG